MEQKQYNFFEDVNQYNVEYLVDKKLIKKETQHLAKTIKEVKLLYLVKTQSIC